MAFGDDPACAALRDDLRLARFVPVQVGDYEIILAWEREALAAGCDAPG